MCIFLSKNPKLVSGGELNTICFKKKEKNEVFKKNVKKNQNILKAKRGFEVEFFRSVCPVFMHDLISFQSMIT